jgi:hypothetical protein
MEDLTWYVESLAILGLLAILQLVAVMRGSAFMSGMSLLLAAPVAVRTVSRSDNEVSMHLLVICSLLVGFFLLSARTRLPSAAIPWWRGFLRPNHEAWIRRVFLSAAAQLLRIPFVATVFGWFGIAFTWLKYLVGGASGFSVANLAFAAGHVVGAFILSNQLAILLVPREAEGALALLALAIVWVPWGVVLAVVGAASRRIQYRVLGSAFLLYPALFEALVVKSKDVLLIALLAIATGAGMWLAGTAASRWAPPAPTTPRDLG